MTTATVTNEISNSIEDLLKQDREDALDELEAIFHKLAHGVEVPLTKLREVIKRADIPADTLDSDRREVKARYESAERIAAADGMADEKSELEEKRRSIIQELQDKLQPVEERLSIIADVENQAQRGKQFLNRTPPRIWKRAHLRVRRQINDITHAAKLDNSTGKYSVLTDSDRDFVEFTNGEPHLFKNTAEGQRVLASVQERLEKFHAMQEEARKKLSPLEARLERLEALKLIPLPSKEQIEAALAEPDREPVQAGDDSTADGDEV